MSEIPQIFKINGVHHFHGNECLCGFSSARSRSRTEHITSLTEEAMRVAIANEIATYEDELALKQWGNDHTRRAFCDGLLTAVEIARGDTK